MISELYHYRIMSNSLLSFAKPGRSETPTAAPQADGDASLERPAKRMKLESCKTEDVGKVANSSLPLQECNNLKLYIFILSTYYTIFNSILVSCLEQTDFYPELNLPNSTKETLATQQYLWLGG